MPTQKKIGKIGPLRFLACGVGGEPWVATRAWAVSTTDASASDLAAWELSLDPPPPDVEALPLHDLKRWVLFGKSESRWLQVGAAATKGVTATRQIGRTAAMQKYLTAVAQQGLPQGHHEGRLSLLVPAIADGARRKRYLDVIREAFPEARVLPEPEMVVEYFRLVQRSLELDRARNNYVLVLDLGASTSNLTIVISNRGDEISSSSKGIQRAGRLRAIHGDSGDAAGQWIDEWIAKRLKIDLSSIEGEQRFEALAVIEKAKVEVSREGSSVEFSIPSLGDEEYTLTPDVLGDAAVEVISRLGELFEDMGQRLWTQLTGTDTASKLSEADRKRRGVEGPEDALHLLDFVLLAGGTSRLRGFRDYLELELESEATFLEVGESFPIAAAVGALAHVLHDKYSPSRLRASADKPLDTEDLEGALDTDLLFAWRHDGTRQRERRPVVLERGDPLVYEGGDRESVISLAVGENDDLLARLVPDVKPMRKGLQPTRVKPRVDNPSLGVRVDSDRRVIMTSPDVEMIQNVRLDLGRYDTIEALSDSPFRGPIAVGELAFDHAEEMVIDFGMSKTVVVASGAGLLDVSDLEGPVLFGPEEPDSVGPVGEGAMDDLELPQPALADDVEPIATEIKFSVDETQEPSECPKRVDPPQCEPLLAQDLAIVRSNEDFVRALVDFLTAAEARSVDIPVDDFVYTLIGLAIRPFVLLSGAPGCGKSTLARLVAHFLRRSPGVSFHEVAVQAHWINDEPLFCEQRGCLRALGSQCSPLVLFDEVNLARPEFYLARFFHAIESIGASTLKLGPTLAIGTLNIDETSRPPSAKVLDRSFLVEVDQVAHTHDLRVCVPPAPHSTAEHGFLPETKRLAPILDAGPLNGLLDTLARLVHEEGLREDLLPSRRALADIRTAVACYESLKDTLEPYLTFESLLDRLISGKVLIRIAGAQEQLGSLVKELHEQIEAQSMKLPRTRRRIGLAKRQAAFGFVYPWQ